MDVTQEQLDQLRNNLSEGHYAEVLIALSPLLGADTSDSDIYDMAGRALIAGLEQEEGFPDQSDAQLNTVFQHLAQQPEYTERPYVFVHLLASLATSGNEDVIGKVVQAFGPVLKQMLEAPAPQKGPVLLMLVLRAYLGDVIPQRRISALHRSWIPHFSGRDFDLPYSGLFFSKIFGRNLQDVHELTGPDPAEYVRRQCPVPSQVLFIEWATGLPVFTAADNSDLAEVLDALDPEHDLFRAELPAVRALVLRYWRPDGRLSPADLARFEVPDALYDMARARLSSARPLTPKGIGLTRKPVQFARSIQAFLPALSRSRVRVAVCISGQLRGWQQAHESWKSHLFSGVDHDIFVHTWSATGSPPPHPVRQVLPFAGEEFCAAWRRIALRDGFKAMKERYPSLFTALAGTATTDAAVLKSTYAAREVVAEDDATDAFAEFSNQDKMHYKIHAAQQLAAQAAGGDLLQSYDLIVRLRPDLPVKLRAFSWRDMARVCRDQPVIFAEKGTGLHYGNLMIGDQLAIGSPKTMQIYADAWHNYPRMAAMDLAHCPEKLDGHLSLAMTCWSAGIAVVQAPARLGTLCNPAVLGSSQILAALEQDNADRDLLDAVRKDLLS